MRRTAALLVLLCLSLSTLFAQHGKSEKNELYNFPYKGDTWTGEIEALDLSTRTITLKYTSKKGDAQEFSGRLLPNFHANIKDSPAERVSNLSVGNKITVYYVAIGDKYSGIDESGKKKEIVATENLIFQADVFPQKKPKS